MKKSSFFFVAISCISLTCLTSCSTAYYNSKPLTSIKTKPKVEEKVAVLYKALTKKESVAYLGRNWQSKGYQPVQIVVENYSDQPVRFFRKGICLPTVDLQMIKEKAHANTKVKALAVGSPSIACIGLGLIGLALSPATFGLSGILLPIAVGGAGVHTASSWIKADMNLDSDYDQKFLRDREIEGGGVLEGIIFVPKEDFIEKFKVKMFDGKNEKLIIVQARKFKG